MRGRLATAGEPILDEAALKRAISQLRTRCPVMRAIHDTTGDPPLRRYPSGFEGVVHIVVGQQVSAASARAIWARTQNAICPFTPDQILAMSDGALRAAGLSRPKIATLRALSLAVRDGLDIDRLASAEDEDVRRALTAVRGIGPWTADIYLLFALGRPDSWPAGDLALQTATGRIFGLEHRPDAAGLVTIAERWQPWRSVAAMLLWAYYGLPPAQQAAGGAEQKTSPKQKLARPRTRT